MFIIPCKYSATSNNIITLVSQIRQYHPDEKIVVVDSASDDKSYFAELKKNNAIIEDVSNKHWMVGAYWHGFKKYPNEEFYTCLHDSTYVKTNIDYLKEQDLFMLATFNRAIGPSFTAWNHRVRDEMTIEDQYIRSTGRGCYGPMFGCKRHVLQSLLDKGADKLMPSTKAETGIMEGTFGLFFEALGYDLDQCSLYGDILELESPGGRSGEQPHYTAWQFPIEKFYASHIDEERL